jgi:hypothetical protein
MKKAEGSFRRGIGAGGMAFLGLALSAGLALAYSHAHTNGVYEICTEDLYLRNKPNGPVIERLKRGTHFEVTSSAGGNWVRGYSSWARKSGWVQNGWFC